MAVQLRCEKIVATINGDPEFQISARLWNTRIRFDVGDHPYAVHVDEGKVVEFTDEPDDFRPYAIRIGGPEEGWEKLLSPVPPPFYQDFWGVFFRHEFEMGGDLESLYAYYGAVRRLLDVMRQTTNEGGS